MKYKMLKFLIATATTFTVTYGGYAYSAEYTFAFAHVLMEDTPNGQAAIKFAQEVGEKSGGRIEINVLPAAQLGGDVEIIEQVQMNLAQIAIPPTATLGNFEPRMQILDLPYILPNHEAMVKVLDGPAGRKILDTLDGHGMYGVNFWGAGFRHMTNNVRPIATVGDLKGIKMRTMQAPVILTQYREWGANPTAMAFAEVYNGLQQGVVDGQENPLANIGAMRFYEVQKFMTLSGHAYHGYAAVVNKQAWETLPDDLKAIMVEAFNNGRDYARDLTFSYEKKMLKIIGKDTKISNLVPESKQAFIKASIPVHKKFEGVVTKELLDMVYKATKINN